MRSSTCPRTLAYEARNLGLVALAMPLLVLAGFGGLTALLLVAGTHHNSVANLVTAALEAGIPLAIGVVVAGLVAQDAAVELQLSLPTAYHRTVTRRFALALAATALVAALATLVLSVAAPWMLHKVGADGQLMWLAPALWFAGVGAVLALLLRSRAASGAALGGIWVAELALHDYFAAQTWAHPIFLFASIYAPDAAFWLTSRLELIGVGVALLLLAWLFLHHPEWRFRAEES